MSGGCGVAHRARAVPPALATTASALVFTQVSAGSSHTCGVTSDNRLYCWGANNNGRVGDGTKTDRLVPVPIGGALRFRQVSPGFFSTCAVTTDYRAYCWGENDTGQLGDGTLSSHLTPVPVTGGICSASCRTPGPTPAP